VTVRPPTAGDYQAASSLLSLVGLAPSTLFAVSALSIQVVINDPQQIIASLKVLPAFS
jgi:hypothetical protein